MEPLFSLEGKVAAVASDGAFAIVAGADVVVYDAIGREVFRVPLAERDPFLGVAKGGKRLAAASKKEPTLTVWDASKKHRTFALEGHLAALYESAGMIFARPQSWGPPVFTDHDEVVTHHESAILVTRCEDGSAVVVASPELTLTRRTWPLDRELGAIACQRNHPAPANATLFVASLVKGDIVTRVLPHAGMPLGAVRVGDAIATIDERACHFFDARSGAEGERVEVPGTPCAIAALSDGAVAVATRAGVLWTFRRGEPSATAHAQLGTELVWHLREEGADIVALCAPARAVRVARAARLEGRASGPARVFEASPRGTSQALFALACGDVAKAARLLGWVTNATKPIDARVLSEFTSSLVKEEDGAAFARRLDAAGLALADPAVRRAFLDLAGALRDLESFVLSYYAWLPVARADPSDELAGFGIALAKRVRYEDGVENLRAALKASLAKIFPGAVAELDEDDDAD